MVDKNKYNPQISRDEIKGKLKGQWGHIMVGENIICDGYLKDFTSEVYLLNPYASLIYPKNPHESVKISWKKKDQPIHRLPGTYFKIDSKKNIEKRFRKINMNQYIENLEKVILRERETLKKLYDLQEAPRIIIAGKITDISKYIKRE